MNEIEKPILDVCCGSKMFWFDGVTNYGCVRAGRIAEGAAWSTGSLRRKGCRLSLLLADANELNTVIGSV